MTSVVPIVKEKKWALAPAMAKPSRLSDPRNSKGQLRTFFVTTRTMGGRSLFQRDRVAQLFIDVLRSYTLAGKLKVHDFVVMQNHVHVPLTVDGEMTIERAMQLIKGNFSYRANKELGFTGGIWQRGLSDVRITGQESFITHQEYIYNNPVKAGLANTPEEYPYSSAYLRKLKRAGAEETVSQLARAEESGTNLRYNSPKGVQQPEGGSIARRGFNSPKAVQQPEGRHLS